ncbi:hypothetical protein HR45_05565 [Shewanella mangrovi]|uniref:DUF2339 domain-containing protein n=1 Tax=Shewanella mangrovi TaxID=1515746 RepID=A0A094JDK1_9GAMM|nr:DUF2339 domain-containing protein [Shewanella mangrovi]KFZ37980.1 hypothetical protein HR45_05565 [Shewanella mangrovi]
MEEILVLLVLVLAVLAILAFVEVQRLTKRVNTLAVGLKMMRQQLESLRHEQAATATYLNQANSDAHPQTAQAEPTPVAAALEPPRIAKSAAPMAAVKAQDDRNAQKHSANRSNHSIPAWQQILISHFKDNWLVWCGGLALVFGLGYLVQFIAHRVDTTPATRIGIALFISLAIIGVGEWLHRKINNGQAVTGKLGKDYIPAAIVAAGTTGVYASLVFATVSYQLLSTSVAMLFIAATALLSLFAGIRYGSLMAVLGLVGGYLAPLWLSSGTGAYFTLACYICAVSAVGLYVLRRCQLPWLLWGVFTGHMLWMALITVLVPNVLWWTVIFYPVSAYLLSTVPAQSWLLRGEAIACRGFQSYFAPVLLSLMLLLGCNMQLLPSNSVSSTMVSLLLALLLWQPMLLLRRHRYHTPALAAWLTLVLASSQYPLVHHYIALPVLVGIVAVWWLLTMAQAYLANRSDDNKVSYWWLVAGPQLLIASLLVYTDAHLPQQLWLSSLLSAVVMAVLAFAAVKIDRLRADFSTAIHALLLVNSALWFDGPTFGLLLALQVLVIVWQTAKQLPVMHAFVPKVFVSLLLLRLTLLPFMPDWHMGSWPLWSLAWVTCIPPLLVLAFAMRIAQQAKLILADWLEGALIHIAALFLFIESHYLVTGSYLVFSDIDLISCSFWLIEALGLCAVYGYRQQRCQHAAMQKFYLVYRQLLQGAAAFCVLLINVQFMPLWSDSVTGADWPVFNPLALGWLIPGALLLLATQRRWLPSLPKIDDMQLKLARYAIGGALVGIWLILSIRQFWQPGMLNIEVGTTMAEWLSYSVTLILAGCALTFGGIRQQQALMQKLGLALLGVAALKVFLSDIGHLDGVWRVVSFLGLGLALIAIGRLFQVLKQRQQAAAESSD